jgi:GNAT superfamily N-acetyltransferase
MNRRLRELEEMVVDAWPAGEMHELEGWLLRASGGPSRRGNSIATLDFHGDDSSLPEALARAEAWYRARSRVPLFQIGPCVQPTDLDAQLEQRGYQKQDLTWFASAAPHDVLERAPRLRWESSVSTRPSPAWTDLCVEQSRFAGSGAAFQLVLRTLGSRARFVLVRGRDGAPSAGALAIASEDQLGIYAMFTSSAARRKGAGMAVLEAAARDALAERFGSLYLLVDADNGPARALYAAAGFKDEYSYHYRSGS